jgi:purine-binding chemotaxis protein CheW
MSEQSNYDIPRILEQMRADYWRNLETAGQEDLSEQNDYIVVLYGDQRFGLPAAACREVLRLPRIVRVPRLPAHLPGIINLRGEIVAVTDLRPLLQLPCKEPTTSFRIVVVADGIIRTALLVEQVEGLHSVAESAVSALAEGSRHGAADLIRGRVDEPAGALMLLEIKRLLGRPELVIDQKKSLTESIDE